MTEIHDAARAQAKGLYPAEAGVELLIRQGKAIYEGAPWLAEVERWDDEPRKVDIDVDQLLNEAGAWSGGEQRLVRIAASLLDSRPVDLSDSISGLDRKHVELVLAALAHANGSHDHSGIDYGPDGRPTGISRRDSLYPWPAAASAASL